MTTQTEEARDAVEGAVSVERALGRLEGKSDILIQTVHEQGRQLREDNRKLDTKIDTVRSDLDTKIDTAKSELNDKIDTAKSELDAKIDAKMDKLLYWILGVGGFTTVTIIASAIAVIFAQR